MTHCRRWWAWHAWQNLFYVKRRPFKLWKQMSWLSHVGYTAKPSVTNLRRGGLGGFLISMGGREERGKWAHRQIIHIYKIVKEIYKFKGGWIKLKLYPHPGQNSSTHCQKICLPNSFIKDVTTNISHWNKLGEGVFTIPIKWKWSHYCVSDQVWLLKL